MHKRKNQPSFNNKPINYWKDLSNVLIELRRIMKKHKLAKPPAGTQLNLLGYSGLARQIFKYYDMPTVRIALGQDEDAIRIKYRWKDLNYTIRYARRIIKKHNLKTLPGNDRLREMGYDNLVYGIKRYHEGFCHFRQLMGQHNYRSPSGLRKDIRFVLQEAQDCLSKHGVTELPHARELRKRGYGKLAGAITKYHGGFSAFRKLLGEQPKTKIRTAGQLEEFLEHNAQAKAIATLSLANGYVSDIADVLVQLWPKRFPFAAQLARSLPGAIQRIGHALQPFDFAYARGISGKLPEMAFKTQQKLEDILYLILVDQYQKTFNQDPEGTLKEIKNFAKDKKIGKLANRVYQFYYHIYSFSIPGHGRVKDYL